MSVAGTKKIVFVSSDIPEAGIERLQSLDGLMVVRASSAGGLDRDRLLEGVREAHGLICLLSDRVDAELMDSAPSLRVIANYAVGYDNIDVEAAVARNIWVCNTPGVLTEATADLAFALLLSVARRIVEADKFTRNGLFRGWAPRLLLGADLSGSVLGIVGMGRIGRAVARRAAAFGMKILYHNRNRLDEDVERELGASYVALDSLLQCSDYVSIHTPGGADTHRLISEREIGLMKKNAILVNTARGTVVDEEALARALATGRIRGAGLDVYENEPEVHPSLLELDNVVLVPHIGSATEGTRNRMAVMAAENVIAALSGSVPPNAVNRLPVPGGCF